MEEADREKPETPMAMAIHSASSSSPSSHADAAPPSWFTPKRLLVIFCLINLINYLDRGTIASNGVNGLRGSCTVNGTCSAGTGIQGAFDLTNAQDGLLSSAFMIGLLIASPIFAALTRSINPFRLIGVGLTVWTIAVIGCGLSFNFWSIIACRMLVGVGEASFISLAAPFIDDNAPEAKKAMWLGAFFMCIPLGFAFGYFYGGLIGAHFSWRIAFFGEAIMMLPFAILGFFIKPLHMKGFGPADSKKELKSGESLETTVSRVQGSNCSGGEKEDLGDTSSDESSKPTITRTVWNLFLRFLKDMKVLLSDKVYLVSAIGYILYTFVMGAYSYWGPKAGYIIYNMTSADMIFGGVTIVCGVVGSVGGGIVHDYMSNTISNAFKLISVSTFFGAIFCLGAFCFKSMYGFVAMFAVGELLIFAAQSPVNFIFLHSVSPNMRPLSMAISTVAIHIFGDVPSTPLIGDLQDRLNNWRITALILTSILFPAAAVWFIGIFFKSVDKFNEDVESGITAKCDGSNSAAPLLNGETAQMENQINSVRGVPDYKSPSLDGETVPITAERNGETTSPVTDECNTTPLADGGAAPVTTKRNTTPLLDGETSEAKSSPST